MYPGEPWRAGVAMTKGSDTRSSSGWDDDVYRNPSLWKKVKKDSLKEFLEGYDVFQLLSSPGSEVEAKYATEYAEYMYRFKRRWQYWYTCHDFANDCALGRPV